MVGCIKLAMGDLKKILANMVASLEELAAEDDALRSTPASYSRSSGIPAMV